VPLETKGVPGRTASSLPAGEDEDIPF